MSIVSGPSGWKLRALGAALGAGFSALVGVLLIWTGIGFYVGIVGIPAGAISGALFAPRLARSTEPASEAVVAACVACVLGIAGHIAVVGVLAAVDPWSDPLLGFAFLAVSFTFGGLIVGLPVAMVVSWLATWSGRRVAGQADSLWLPAVMGALVMAALTGLHLVRSLGLAPY